MKYSTTSPLKCIMKDSTCYRGTYIMKPKGVLWHCTGANNPNLWRYVQPPSYDPNKDALLKKLGVNYYGSDWNRSEVGAGVNAWIGKAADGEVIAVQTLPWNYAPWGCAGGWAGSANGTHIQFEMCEDALTDKDYFEKCYREGVELTAYLCKMYGFDPHGTTTVGAAKVPVILCHHDAYKLGVGSGHYDVYNWFNKYGRTMDNVRDDVAKLLAEPDTDRTIWYRAHCQQKGWMAPVKDGEWAGTKGEGLRLEAFKITPPPGVELEVTAHLQGIGDVVYKGIKRGVSSGTNSSENDPIIGTVGESRRLEGFSIKLTKNPGNWKIYYQGHCQTIGDTAVCGEGEYCGTRGLSKRLEALRIGFKK